MATVLTKQLLQETIETIQQVYMEDNILAKILPFYEQILHSLKIL